MNSGTGIQDLMAAETRASQIVAEARIARGDRMKQAQVDADELIAAYRLEQQDAFDKKANADGGSGNNASVKLQAETNAEIQDMQGQFNQNAQKAVDVLLRKCCEVSLEVPSARIRSTQKIYGKDEGKDGKKESSKEEAEEEQGKGVIISNINYKGHVKGTESDEYVEVTNGSKATVDISGYSVLDIDHHGTLKETVGTTFVFPTPTELTPGQTVRVYTNQIHKKSGGYSFGSGKAIWNNKGGKGVLMNRAGTEISQFVYISRKQLLTDIANTNTQLDKARDERQVKNREWRRLRKLNARPMTTREEKIERREIRANLKIAAKEFTLASKMVTDLKKALKALEGQLEQMKKLGSSCSKVEIHSSDFSDDDSDIESQRCAGEDINVSDISDSECESQLPKEDKEE
ncbi:V-type proton ATPase subunit G [Skeletonema marinoi]|uniref:V-type proton ATPase subunit G n=1 Tax=Skeletonema marinoi TaxID=267567 RepID=A0AAD8Y1L1_9STRA|nr:V-type proton ATPase subunit G [Skeletonema marinoi]